MEIQKRERILLFVAITSLALNFYITYTNSKNFETEIRPYLAISSVDTNTDTTTKRTAYILHIKNFGGIPAKLDKLSINCSSEGYTSATTSVSQGLIGKEQELLREFSIAVSESQCTIFFSYSKATDPSNAYPYETNYGFTHEYLKAPGSTLAGMK